ncbi:MAG: hypothetical protein AAF266_15980, partial [Planctomycetota bacterium]
SIGGAAILGTKQLDADLLLLDFGRAGAPGHQAIARIAWTKGEGEHTKVGCAFLHTPKTEIPLG